MNRPMIQLYQMFHYMLNLSQNQTQDHTVGKEHQNNHQHSILLLYPMHIFECSVQAG